MIENKTVDYELESAARTNRQERQLEVAEIRMFSKGVKRKDMI